MLGIYVHTHWGYNHPYAARTWTLQDWQGYLAGLRALGYDLVMFWPLIDDMPAASTPADLEYLSKIRAVIDIAHQQFDMKFVLLVCPNVVGNEHAAGYTPQTRPYFQCETKVNPADRAAVDAMLAAHRWQLEPLAAADGIAIIDSDPGGYIGSTNAEFIELLRVKIALFREFNPNAELIYWMWFGWENYNRFWADVQHAEAGDADPQIHWDVAGFAETLALLKQRIPEPWWLYVNFPEHLRATGDAGMVHKRMHIAYGTIEREPTFPLINYDPAAVRAPFDRYPDETFPMGLMANAQTHCLQLPHTYLYAHFGRGGTLANADVPGFAEELLPGAGEKIAAAWQAIAGSGLQQRAASQAIRQQIGRAHKTGKYAGLLFGDPDRFLMDLALNLQVRAALADLKESIAAGDEGVIKTAVRAAHGQLKPYQQRLGFADAYGDPMHEMLNQQLARLNDPRLQTVLNQFHDWRHPAIRNGVTSRLLDAMEDYAAR